MIVIINVRLLRQAQDERFQECFLSVRGEPVEPYERKKESHGIYFTKITLRI